jgi:NAD+ dependent glucose-6-phosphate dehydrogenase
MATQQRVLITGAAGRIGQIVVENLADRYDFLLSDIRPLPGPTGLPFVQADIAQLDAVRPLCRGVDTVLHLAADARTDAPWESLLSNNIVGTYNVFQAAHEAACRRVIFASSVMAVNGYPTDVQVDADMPLRPLNLYGATKAWGEALGSFYAYQKGLSVLCLRLGWLVERHSRSLVLGHPLLTAALTHDDLVRFIAAALEASADLQFGIYHGVSGNRRKRLDIEETSRALGYAPRDDAFELARRDYWGTLRRYAGQTKRQLRSAVRRRA